MKNVVVVIAAPSLTLPASAAASPDHDALFTA
jgi:hypothetical protein